MLTLWRRNHRNAIAVLIDSLFEGSALWLCCGPLPPTLPLGLGGLVFGIAEHQAAVGTIKTQ